MIKSKKVKMMTKIAVEDKKYNMSNNKVSGISVGDYISLNCFSAFISYSLCFIIVSGMISLIFFEKIVSIILNFNIMDAFYLGIFAYLIGLIAYLLIIVVISYRRYSHERKYIIRNNRRINILKQNFYNER